MTAGIFFTVILSWCIGALATWQFFVYSEKRKDIRPEFWESAFSFSLFWLFMGVVWWIVGLADLLAWAGESTHAYTSVLLLQAIVGLDMGIIWWYFAPRFFPQSLKWSILFLAAGVVIGFEATLFTYGVIRRPLTFFSSQLVLNPRTQLLFGLLFFPAFILGLIDFVRTLSLWGRKEKERAFITVAALSLVVLGIGGSVEQFGIVAAWQVPLARLLTLVASMCGYLAVTNLGLGREKETFVI